MNAKMDATTDACDLRFGQVGIACVRVRRPDAAALCEELERRVRAAPQLFSRAAVVLDLSHLLNLPDDGTVDALLEAIRSAGMLPVGLAYGTSATEALAQRMGLPLIAKFRAAYEPADGGSIAPPAPSAAPASRAQTRCRAYTRTGACANYRRLHGGAASRRRRAFRPAGVCARSRSGRHRRHRQRRGSDRRRQHPRLWRS